MKSIQSKVQNNSADVNVEINIVISNPGNDQLGDYQHIASPGDLIRSTSSIQLEKLSITDSETKKSRIVPEEMDIDDDSISVTSAFEEEQSQKIVQVQGDIAKYEFELRALDNKANLLMELPQSTEDEVKQFAFQLDVLEKKQAFYNRKFVEAHERLKCYREEAKSFSSPSGKQDGRAIKPKDLPIFEVKPSNYKDFDNELNPNSINATNDNYSLETFILKFERVYKDNKVNVNKHWRYNLESCLEKTKIGREFYTSNIRNKKLSWKEVKQLLKNRFDIASKCKTFQCNTMLLNLKQGPNQSVVEYLDRFQHHVVAAKVKVEDNFLLSTLFINSLHHEDFKQRVLDTLKDHYKLSLPAGSTLSSKYADISDEDYVPSNFSELHSILCKAMFSLEKSHAEIVKKDDQKDSSNKKRKLDDNRSSNQQNKKPYKGNNSNNNNFNYKKLKDIRNKTGSLNKDEIQFLRDNGFCTFCRVVKYSVEHGKTCSE
ncbi:hypothetical protein BDF20DRAFT_104024 [Mycotypha africana]|uniref:uncharacterized protein n=1 Tax=Mycotypha africana TaxID=64632 RepID=UPI0022FFD713|nr:uncharacterized protein BDF20DRAFT_104024 [Mycotypha africana]KAI8970105.1 hypothetical protein BDF20DRAFT_104024 [Mycotypha africana]